MCQCKSILSKIQQRYQLSVAENATYYDRCDAARTSLLLNNSTPPINSAGSLFIYHSTVLDKNSRILDKESVKSFIYTYVYKRLYRLSFPRIFELSPQVCNPTLPIPLIIRSRALQGSRSNQIQILINPLTSPPYQHALRTRQLDKGPELFWTTQSPVLSPLPPKRICTPQPPCRCTVS
jgi:hypothetical protein